MRDFWPIVSVQIHSNHRAMGADKCALLYLDIDRLTTISMPATNKSAIDGQDTIVNIIAARGAPNYRNYGANKRRRERLAALFLVSEQSGGSMAGDPEAWGVKQGVLAWGTTRTCSAPCTWCRLICNGQSMGYQKELDPVTLLRFYAVQNFKPIWAPLSLKAALLLAERIATVSDRCGNTGPYSVLCEYDYDYFIVSYNCTNGDNEMNYIVKSAHQKSAAGAVFISQVFSYEN